MNLQKRVGLTISLLITALAWSGHTRASDIPAIKSTSLAEWYAAGAAAKFIVGTLLDDIRTDYDNKLEANLAQAKQMLSTEEFAAKEIQLKHDKEEFKTRTDAVSEMIFGSLKLILTAWYDSTGASLDTTASVANAFNSGLKFWILKRTLSYPFKNNIRELIELKTSYPYEFTPIKPLHTTAWYCGPKDPYCLYGVHQATIDENIEQLRSDLAVWLPIITDIIAGIAFATVGSYVSKKAISLATTIGTILLPLTQQIGTLAPATLSSISEPATAIIKKGIKRYLAVETRNILKNNVLDLIYATGNTQERAQAEKDIKYGFNVRTIATKALPAHSQLIADFLAT